MLLRVKGNVDIVDQLERLFHKLGTLGMACEAIDDRDQKNALAGSVADAQTIVSDMMENLREARSRGNKQAEREQGSCLNELAT